MAWHQSHQKTCQIQSCIAYQKLKNPSYFSSSKCKALSAFLPKHFINLCAWKILSRVHICELRISTSTRPSKSAGNKHEVSTSASKRKRSILWLSCLFRCQNGDFQTFVNFEKNKTQLNLWMLFLKITYHRGCLGKISKNREFLECRRILENYRNQLSRTFV